MSRSVSKATRVFVEGLDMSGYSRSIGPLDWTYEWAKDEALAQELYGYLPDQVTLGLGQLNAAFDNTASIGPHENFKDAEGQMRTVMVAIGRGGSAPVPGDPIYTGQFAQGSYLTDPGQTGQTLSAQMDFSHSAQADLRGLYAIPWGVLLKAKGVITGINAAQGILNPFTGIATAHGGFMVYQVLAADDDVELTVQDAATNVDGSFVDLVSSGVVGPGASGIVPLARGATVEAYTRWQLGAGTQATYVDFVLGFVRSFGQ
ncbi:MAG: hypothetical protein KF821_09020 [Anaerolineales bacterium]|nr:hypothetical protein [Anaerolineales bacterium]